MKVEIEEKWFRDLVGHCTPGTINLYRGRMQKFGDFLAEQDRPLDREAIKDFLYDILERGLSKRYFNLHLTVIKSYCKWLFQDEDEKKKNPAASVKMIKEDPPDSRFLSEEEYRKVLAVAQGIDRDIITFLCNTGLRVTEFNSLKWQDITPDMSFVTVIGKGNKRRVVPLNDTCREILQRHKASNGNGDGKLPITRRTRHAVTRICIKLGKKAGIPRFGPHACRHYFATQLLLRGVAIQMVAKLLGHASVKLTEKVYLHLVPMDLLGLTDVLVD